MRQLNYYERRDLIRESEAIKAGHPEWLTKDQHAAIRTFYEDAGSRPSRHAVDHIVPLNHPDVCGLHVPWNLQVLSRTANSEKSNKFDGTMENNGWRKTSTPDCV